MLGHGRLDFEPAVPLTARIARPSPEQLLPSPPKSARFTKARPQRASRDGEKASVSPKMSCALQAARTMAGRTVGKDALLEPLGPPIDPKAEHHEVQMEGTL
eukprot:7065520-Prymnesium_polylepis.2